MCMGKGAEGGGEWGRPVVTCQGGCMCMGRKVDKGGGGRVYYYIIILILLYIPT